MSLIRRAARAAGARLAGALAIVCAGAACAEPVPPMRIGTVLWPGSETLFHAERRGLMAAADFRLVEYTNGSEVMRSFRNRSIEAAQLTLDEVLTVAHDGMDPVVLIALDESAGADAVLAHAGTPTMAALKGKRVGFQVNSVSGYVLRRALQHGGLGVDDIHIVNLSPERHRAWFVSGEVDAVVTYEPMRSQVVAAGGIDLFNSAAIPGEVMDLLVVRRDYLEAQPRRAAALHDAWRRALPDMHASPDARQWASRRLGIAPQEFSEMLRLVRLLDADGNRAQLRGPKPVLLDSAARVRAHLRESGMLSRDLPLETLVALPPAVARLIWRE